MQHFLNVIDVQQTFQKRRVFARKNVTLLLLFFIIIFQETGHALACF